MQDYYPAIKNELLSYKQVKARTSWKCETFKRGRVMLSHVNVMGKNLYVYLALDPEVFGDRMYASDASAKMADTPLLIKVKNERSMNQALTMIAMLMVLIYSFVHTARNNQQVFDLFIGSSIMKSYMKDG